VCVCGCVWVGFIIVALPLGLGLAGLFTHLC
jgi:hypothetical protein